MSTKHLIPIVKGQTDLPRRGGLRKSQQKRFSNILKGCKKAMCKNCKFECYMKKLNLQRNPEQICLAQKERAKAVYVKPLITKRIFEEALAYRNIPIELINSSNPKDLALLSKTLFEQKRKFYNKI